jgi:cbb3-type cytochrome oxidase subunit 3
MQITHILLIILFLLLGIICICSPIVLFIIICNTRVDNLLSKKERLGYALFVSSTLGIFVLFYFIVEFFRSLITEGSFTRFYDFQNLSFLLTIVLVIAYIYFLYKLKRKRKNDLEKEMKNESLENEVADWRNKYNEVLKDSSKIKEEALISYFHDYEYIKITEFFNNDGQCVKKERETLNHKPFHVAKPLKEINTYAYLKGLLCLEKVYKPDIFTNEIDLKAEPHELVRYEYDKNKKCTLEEHYNSDNILESHDANEYDGNGNCIKTKRNFMGDLIMTYTKYDSRNLCIEETCHSNQIGFLNSKNLFEYNQEGNCTKQIYTNLMKFSVDFNKTTEYQYEYENNKCVREFEIVEGDIVDNKKLLQEYTYDNHGNCIMELDYRNDRGLRSRIYRTFNDDNEVNIKITEEGTSIKVENFQRKKIAEL